jgi:hypothetical protein
MGLGKTITFAEYIIQLIAQSSEPKIHLVVSPASLTHQHFEDLPLHFMEAVIVAWQLSGKNATPAMYEQLYSEYFADENNPKALVSFLRILPYFNASLKNAKQKFIQFISQTNLQERILIALTDHLNEIDGQIATTPSLKDAYMESYNALLETTGKEPNTSHQELLSFCEHPVLTIEFDSDSANLRDVFSIFTPAARLYPRDSRNLMTLRSPHFGV